MAHTISVNIDGTTYNLKGDDEELILGAAESVNSQISQIKSKHKEEVAGASMWALAAMNIAGSEIKAERQGASDRKYFLEEVSQMSDYLYQILTK